MTPLIIEIAINGGTTKARNPYTPHTPAEIAKDAIACMNAGAAIIHSHIHDYTINGAACAERYLEGYRPIMKERPDAILCPTATTGATIEDKWRHMEVMAESGLVRMGVIDPGTMNVAYSGENGMPGKNQRVYQVTLQDVAYILDLYRRCRLGVSAAAYEPGYLHLMLAYQRNRLLPPGTMVKLYFSGDHNFYDFKKGGFRYFGVLPTRKGFEAYHEMVEGSGLVWSVAVPGGDPTSAGLSRLAIERGGHVRIGLEDYAGDRTPTNVELVEEVVKIARDVGRPVADPKTAAAILGLPR